MMHWAPGKQQQLFTTVDYSHNLHVKDITVLAATNRPDLIDKVVFAIPCDMFLKLLINFAAFLLILFEQHNSELHYIRRRRRFWHATQDCVAP